MKLYDQILLGTLLFSSVCVVASTTGRKSVECTRPRGSMCEIKTLPSSEGGSDKTELEFPDLSKRTALKILDGTLSNLTESMASNLKVRILWMEGVGLKSFFVSPYFEELHLRANQLTTLESKSSSSFALKFLDVRKNQLKNASQLQAFVALEELYLDDNKIDQLEMDMFTRMPNLRVLSAPGNGLVRVVPPISTLMLNELVTLSLGHNQLSSIAMDNWQVPSLQTLLLSNNGLKELSGMDGFEQFYDLNRMELAGNRWSCGWLEHALANVTVRKAQNDAEGVTLDADTNCLIEKVRDICCSFTPMAGQGEEQLFTREIRQVRDAIEAINRRHEEFKRYESNKLSELRKTLQEHLEDLRTFFTEQENESEREKVQATQIVQKADQLSEEHQKMSSEIGVAEKNEHERKRLLHFMVDMKNRLLRQAIDTDSLWVQANEEKANIEQLFKERPQSQP